MALMVMSPSTYTCSPKVTFIALLTTKPSILANSRTCKRKAQLSRSAAVRATKSPNWARATVKLSPTWKPPPTETRLTPTTTPSLTRMSAVAPLPLPPVKITPW